MKTIFFISLLVFPIITSASTVTAISSGNWNSAGTWTIVPVAGDEIIVPSGITVNINISTPMILRLINNGTVNINNDAISVLNVSQNIYNNNNFINDGKALVHGSIFNIDTISGDGAFCIWDTTSNTQFIGGTIDFCDITPPANPPYIDFNSGTVLGTVTFCQAGYCSPAGIKDAEENNSITISPNISIGIFQIKNYSNHHLRKFLVTDTTGRIVYRTDNNFSEINLTQCESGIYFYVLEDELENIYTGKLMKE